MQKRETISGRRFNSLIAVGCLLALSACGYSQEEWDQKLREGETLRQQNRAQQQQNQKCDADYQASISEVQDLKRQLAERGVNLNNLTQSLEEQKIALKEYEERAAQLEKTRKRFELLRAKLQKLTQLGLRVQVRDNRMLIQLPGDVLFASGKDELTDDGLQILSQVAAVIRADETLSHREFQIAGHTDNIPLTRGRSFKDNWGLSAMRARSVLVHLTGAEEEGGGGLTRSNWSAAGYGSTDPVASNDSVEGRTSNRRVELVVLPDVKEMLNLNSLVK